MRLQLSGVLCATAILSGTAAQAQTRLVVNCFWPPQHPVCREVLPNWLAEVARVTEGRVTGIVPPRSVAPPPEQLASVESGVVDVAVQFNGLIQNRINGPIVAMQPFVGSENAQIMTQALWDTNRAFFPDEFDTVELLTQWVITPGQLFSMTDTPITTVEQMNGLRIWTLPGPVTQIATALGAGAVATPAVQSNDVISRGVVDAHFGLGAESLRSFQALPYTRSMTRFSQPVYSTSFSMVMNRDRWNAIPAADQEAIRGVSGAVLGRTAAAVWDRDSAEVLAMFPDQGITIVDADPALEDALKAAAAPITAAWIERATAAGIDAQGALDFYSARLQELSR